MPRVCPEVLAAIRSLRCLESAHAAIVRRPVDYPYRCGTIPHATKVRKLKKLAKDMRSTMALLAPTA